MENIVLIGYGGHAKSVADTIERQGLYKIVGYTDNYVHESPYPYLGNDDNLQEIYDSGVVNACICIGYMGKNRIREVLYARLVQIGFSLPVIIDPSAIVSRSAFIGEGTFVGKSCVLNADSSVGKCCIINTAAIVEHETIVGDFCHISVGTVLCGQVRVGYGAFVGANATVIQCRNVEPYEIVPAGSTKRR